MQRYRDYKTRGWFLCRINTLALIISNSLGLRPLKALGTGGGAATGVGAGAGAGAEPSCILAAASCRLSASLGLIL